ncbi:MAG: PleD family two-component system response regulator [Elusimicrobiota bacterium]
MTPFILAADDDETWRELVPLWIRSNGWEAATVSCGADVIPTALKRRPDCIVLDHELGDTTGMEVCAKLKAHPQLRNVPVIVFTTMADQMIKIVEGGRPDHFVVKDGRPEELLAVIESLLPGFEPPPVSFKDPT